MKNVIKNIVAATLISAAFAGSAFAMTASNQSVWDALHAQNFSTHGLNLSVSDGVVTLAGDVENALDRELAARAVRGAEGVTGVINLVTTN